MSNTWESPSSPWWTDAAPPARPFEGEMDADVIIIGGGIAGVTLAYTLAEQDAVVGLFEAGELASGATGRSAGFLNVAPPEPYQDQVAMWGRLPARAVLETGRRSHRRVRELIEALQIDCDYRSNGSVRLARTEEETEDIRASLPLLAADGFACRETRVTEVVPAGATQHFNAAFLFAEDGELDPVRFVRGVARAALAKGARLFARSPVLRAHWRSGLWEVTLPNGRARARAIVLATNAGAPLLCPRLEGLIRPRRGQMLATEPLERVFFPRPTTSRWGYHYWRQTPDLRLIIGGWRDLDLDGEVGYEQQPTPKIQSGIENGLAELLPDGARIERRWAGTMGFARDGRPLVGWLDADHHLAMCAGFTGHGLSMAPGCTLELADLLSWKRAPGIGTFDPMRFPELKEARAGIGSLGEASEHTADTSTVDRPARRSTKDDPR